MSEKSRNAYLKRTYGISEDQYHELLDKQGGVCYICERSPEELGRNLHVDHDHKTSEIRGLLCAHCNHRRVGRNRREHSDLIRRIAEYLEAEYTGLIVPLKKRKKRGKKRSTTRARTSTRGLRKKRSSRH